MKNIRLIGKKKMYLVETTPLKSDAIKRANFFRKERNMNVRVIKINKYFMTCDGKSIKIKTNGLFTRLRTWK